MTRSRPKTFPRTRAVAPTAADVTTTTAAAPFAALPHDDDSSSDDGGDALSTLGQAWRFWLPPAVLALLLTIFFRDPFAGDWDALDYTVNAVQGQPSSMLFGRMLFIFTNHAAYRLAHSLFGLPSEQAYLLFKYMVVAQTPFAVVACWTLARELTGSLRAATVAAFMLALSPFFVVYSGQAMTETPSLLVLCIALVMHLRGVRGRKSWQILAGAGLLGLCVNIREPMGFYGVWLILAPLCYGWQLKRRELFLTALACMLFLVCALAPFAAWWLLDVGGYREAWFGWVASMRAESAVHPVRLSNLVPFFGLFFIAAPVTVCALPFALRREWRERRGWTPLLVMALVGLFVNLVLLANYSVVINGRYQLTGLPGLVPLTAAYLFRRATERTRGSARRGLIYACAVVVAVALVTGPVIYFFAARTLRHHALTKVYRARLALLPADAVVMVGGQTVAVNYYRGLGLGRWETIGTGGGWPGAAQLAPHIERHLQHGRPVFVDVDPRLWSMESWHEQETRALVNLQARFRFRRVSETIYEIRPFNDETARDDPNLRVLLDNPGSRFR